MTFRPEDAERIEAVARDLCATEGWNPDEIIACEPNEVAGARRDVSGAWVCRHWQAYVRAAERTLKDSDDEWEVF